MSREIKFRVWDRRQGRYLATNDDVNYELLDTYEASIDQEMGRGVGLVTLGWAIKRPESYVVEQFVGLKDKNGREIYEGDIVTWQVKNVKGPFPFRVEYLSDRAMFGIATDKTFDTFEGYMDMTDDVGGDVGKLFEVIGNIHETPELLKGVTT